MVLAKVETWTKLENYGAEYLSYESVAYFRLISRQPNFRQIIFKLIINFSHHVKRKARLLHVPSSPNFETKNNAPSLANQ